MSREYHFRIGTEDSENLSVTSFPKGDGLVARLGDREVTYGYRELRDGEFLLEENGLVMRGFAAATEGKIFIHLQGRTWVLESLEKDARWPSASAGPGVSQRQVVAEMPGKVMKIPVAEGEQVEKGGVLVVLEAMKMESPQRAMVPVVVKKILVSEGDQVDSGKVLLEIEPVDSED